MKKSEIRKEIFKIRKSLPSDTIVAKSKIIEEKVKEKIKSCDYDIILSYADFGGEVMTDSINEFIIESGLKLYLPRVLNKENSTMAFYKVDSLNKLVVDHYGIREPLIESEMFNYDSIEDSKVLMLIPGVAFDKNNNRVGYGKGYYDSFLCKKDRIYKTALSFDFQIVDHIETDISDIKMDEIITE